ncbi:hypothetical protein Pmani_034688 [Petrolisthes manimaculis]|uniref:Uncharacterized protein n=1 Tax=Petrolisthes manimaculis TaxID=1843537 RepID=A0AAE1NN72_9EUCA|nr:hypothetical protein Pmani_034688 [Petrolisthes manimaculis]
MRGSDPMKDSGRGAGVCTVVNVFYLSVGRPEWCPGRCPAVTLALPPALTSSPSSLQPPARPALAYATQAYLESPYYLKRDPEDLAGSAATPPGGDLMTLSPRHTTPFSVSDILSPLEEQRRALDLLDDRRLDLLDSGSYGRAAAAAAAMQPAGMQHVAYPPAPPPTTYCTPDVYDARASAPSWYQTSSSDPRFAMVWRGGVRQRSDPTPPPDNPDVCMGWKTFYV